MNIKKVETINKLFIKFVCNEEAIIPPKKPKIPA